MLPGRTQKKEERIKAFGTKLDKCMRWQAKHMKRVDDVDQLHDDSFFQERIQPMKTDKFQAMVFIER
ncbi:hypothetical protein AAVH_22076, partial [Aphelenchoides avenae]